MKTKIIFPFILLATILGIYSCSKEAAIHTLNSGNFTDTTGTLKSVATFPIGLATDYSLFLNNPTYSATVAREANSTTFGYVMKHGSIVQGDGSLKFDNADAQYNAAAAAGLEVYGHTLCWYANQNATYLKVYSGAVVPPATNLLANPGFELGSGTSFTNWSAYNGGTSFSSGGPTASEVHGGSRSLKVVVAADNPGKQYAVQLASDLFNTTVGTTYTVTYWIRAISAGGSVRLSTQPTASYEPDQTVNTTYTQVTWTFTAKDLQTRVLIDIGLKANTYFVDDMAVFIPVIAPGQAAVAAKLDTAMGKFITGMVTHYQGKVKAWDVVNEPLADNGALRNNSNTSTTPSDVFVWQNYMGKDFALKAFNYAQAADPNALLFINDYNLENNNGTGKIDSLIAYVNYLKDKGAKIDGIGTQLHININTSYAGIDVAFQKLAATGLKVRISEMEVRANPFDKANFDPAQSPLAMDYQAVMYKYVINSYMKYVPAAQRYGVTIWGVDDKDSWILVNQNKIDAPLLFNNSFAKKPAYSAVLQALRGQ